MTSTCSRRSSIGLAVASVLLGLTAAPGAALAQDAPASPRLWSLEPSVSIKQTFTDNYRIQSAAASDSITELIAALRWGSRSGAVRGFFDYSLTASAFAKHDEENEVRHFLSSALTAELVNGAAYVDLRGSYTQQVVSAFGAQQATTVLANANQEDVGSFAVSPYLVGRLGSLARYEARLSHEITRVKGSATGDVDNSLASLRLDGGQPGARLSWGASASHAVSDFDAGRRTKDSRLRATVDYLIGTDVKVGVIAGRERTDLLVLDGQSYNDYGAQMEWTPTERTRLFASAEKRFFGTGHSVQFSHRTQSTVWTLLSSRDVSTSSAQGTGGFGSAYDLFFRQFASVEPDAAKRDVLVRNYLQTNNINPNSVVVGGFLASSATLQNTQAASVALVGVRNSVTLRLVTSRSERADGLSSAFDDLSQSTRVRERGASVDWALRLSPVTVINVAGSWQRNTGDLATQQSTLKSITATWGYTVSPRSTLQAGARGTRFESSLNPYDENAVFASFRYAF